MERKHYIGYKVSVKVAAIIFVGSTAVNGSVSIHFKLTLQVSQRPQWQSANFVLKLFHIIKRDTHSILMHPFHVSR